MKTNLECIPCLASLALRTARQVTGDAELHERVLREATAQLSRVDLTKAPPQLASPLFQLVCQAVGDADPLRAIRERDNELALELTDELRQRIATSADPLGMALRLAAAGNAIDFAACGTIGAEQLRESIDHALAAPFDREIAQFRQALGSARDVLFLADNAGEIALDRLLLEQLPSGRTTVAVRGGPSLNDATRADAEAVGLTDLCEVIDNGSLVPGTVLSDCSRAFVDRFAAASLIIAKGQGNYETLCHERANIVFILKVKCSLVAERLGRPLGSIALVWETP